LNQRSVRVSRRPQAIRRTEHRDRRLQRRFRGIAEKIQSEAQTDFPAAGRYGIRSDRAVRRAADEKFPGKIVSGNCPDDVLDRSGRKNPRRLGQSDAQRACYGSAYGVARGIILRRGEWPTPKHARRQAAAIICVGRLKFYRGSRDGPR
jgi:hypothetical protein